MWYSNTRKLSQQKRKYKHNKHPAVMENTRSPLALITELVLGVTQFRRKYCNIEPWRACDICPYSSASTVTDYGLYDRVSLSGRSRNPSPQIHPERLRGSLSPLTVTTGRLLPRSKEVGHEGDHILLILRLRTYTHPYVFMMRYSIKHGNRLF